MIKWLRAKLGIDPRATSPVRTLFRRWQGWPQLTDWQTASDAKQRELEDRIIALEIAAAEKKLADYEASPEWQAIQKQVKAAL